MSIKINFNGVSILKPGAYSVLNTTLLTDTQLGESGIVAIIGEADGGEPGVLDVISPAGFQAAKIRYKSGPIAKAFELLANPSNDPRTPNGASRVVVYKTNNSTQATKDITNNLTVPGNVFALKSLNYGVDENNINVLISQGSDADENANVIGTVAGPYTLLGSDTIVVNHGGVVYTYTSSLGAGSFTLTQVVDDINNSGNWAASRPVQASEVTVGSSVFIKLTLLDLTDAAKLEYGVMDIDATSTMDTILGLVNTAVRGVKGSRIIIENKDNVTNTSTSLGGEEILEIQYTGAGTAAVLEIQDVSGVKTLTTTITGAASDGLVIDLTNVSVEQLVNQINASAVYTCTSDYFNKASVNAAAILDYYNNLDILAMPAVLYNTVVAVVDYINANSQFVGATLVADAIGQIATINSAEFLTGGTKGISTNTNFQNGFDALKGVRVNIVVPLVSKDGENGSTYTIDSVNAQADAHCNFMSSTLGKSERNCYVSKTGDKDVVKAAARALNSRHTSMVAQKVTALDEFGNLIQHEEYALACLCAGLQSGSEVGEPITYKLLRIFALAQDASFDPRIDFDEMIEAGITLAEQTDAGTFRIILGNTTYSKDGNIVFNRISINEAANYVAFELRQHLESLFVGTKARTGTAEAIKNAAVSKLEQLRTEDIIVDGNEEDGTIIPAFRNIQVQISGVTCQLDVTITPVPGIDFKLQTIYLTSLQASASA